MFSVICLYLVCIKSSALFSRLPLRGGSAAQRRWRGPPRLPPSGFSCRAAVSRQLRQLSCPQSGLKRSIVPYSRLPLGGKLSTKLTDEGAATLTLLKNFKQTDSRPPRLPLRGGSAAQRRWRGSPRLPPSGFSCRAAVSRQLRQLSCPQSGLKRTPPHFLRFFKKEIKILRKFRFLGIRLPVETCAKIFFVL